MYVICNSCSAFSDIPKSLGSFNENNKYAIAYFFDMRTDLIVYGLSLL